MNCTLKNLPMPVFTVLQTLSFVRWAAILILKFGHMPWQNRKKTSVFFVTFAWSTQRVWARNFIHTWRFRHSSRPTTRKVRVAFTSCTINLSSLKTEQVVTQIIICSIVVRRRFRTFERSFVYCNKLDLRHNLSGIWLYWYCLYAKCRVIHDNNLFGMIDLA